MPERIFLFLIEFLLFIWMIGPFRIAAATSAVILVTVTVLKPIPTDRDISVTPASLDMTGKTSGELTLSNHTAEWREVRIELVPMTENGQGCNLIHSPSFTNLAPKSDQIVRVMLWKQNESPCLINHKFVITDTKNLQSMTIDVPLISASNGTPQ